MLNEKFDSLLAAFGDTIGIPGLAADESGISMLAFDDVEIVIQHLPDGEMLLLYAYIGSIPVDDKELLYSYLLSSNSFFKETGGATLAIDIPTNAVGMHVAYPLMALDNELFENLLENFVNMAESWINKIDKFPAILSETGFQAPGINKTTMPPAGGNMRSPVPGMPPAGGNMRPPAPGTPPGMPPAGGNMRPPAPGTPPGMPPAGGGMRPPAPGTPSKPGAPRTPGITPPGVPQKPK